MSLSAKEAADLGILLDATGGGGYIHYTMSKLTPEVMADAPKVTIICRLQKLVRESAEEEIAKLEANK